MGLLTAVRSISAVMVASAKTTVLGDSPKRRENHDKNRFSKISPRGRSFREFFVVHDRHPVLVVIVGACLKGGSAKTSVLSSVPKPQESSKKNRL